MNHPHLPIGNFNAENDRKSEHYCFLCYGIRIFCREGWCAACHEHLRYAYHELLLTNTVVGCREKKNRSAPVCSPILNRDRSSTFKIKLTWEHDYLDVSATTRASVSSKDSPECKNIRLLPTEKSDA